MKKVLLINGSPHEKGCVARALREVAGELRKNGVEAEIVWIGIQPIAGCIACGICHKNGGKCFRNDLANAIGEKMQHADGIILGSPVYYSGANGSLCSLLDRVFFSHKGMAGKLGASVVSCRRAGSTATFERLNQYFLINNMHVVGSQYWNEVHGYTAEDVEKDLEGLQTMRTLAKNMAYLLHCLEAGEKAGVEKPTYEKGMTTNFIR